MKRIYFLIVIAGLVFTSCNNAERTENAEDATENGTSSQGEVSFTESVYDFGTVSEGEVIDHVFTFTNTGSEPVIISRVSASCGCTTPTYTTVPVLPGKEGEVAVQFDTKGQVGTQQKIITIASNGQNSIQTIQLRGTVN